jgi:uncharacterized protein involved in exopolysaccharide biosynthesis
LRSIATSDFAASLEAERAQTAALRAEMQQQLAAHKAAVSTLDSRIASLVAESAAHADNAAQVLSIQLSLLCKLREELRIGRIRHWQSWSANERTQRNSAKL